MKNSFWKTTLAVIVGMFFYSILSTAMWMLIMVNIMITGTQSKQIPRNAYLKLNFSRPIQDKVLVQDFSSFSNQGPVSLVKIIRAIEFASHDPHIKGLLINTRTVNGDWAQTEEIRRAIKEFKTSGKPVIAFSDVYDQKAYYLATVADKIYLVPSGNIIWKGLAAQIFYYKNLLDKLGIKPILIRHGEYKSAGEPFVKDHISPENREQYKLLLTRLWENVINATSATRHLNKDTLNSLAEHLALHLGSDAVKSGLVDAQIYYDQLLDTLRSRAMLSPGKKLKFVDINKYASSAVKIPQTSRNKIAIVFAQGNIVDVPTNLNINTPQILGSRYAQLLKKLRDDPNIKAIVLRVNSPGGSALASERIWRQVKLTSQVKPVIVSMGGVAASGGYYISCAANKIVADSSTITGSIGVFGLLFDLERLVTDKLHINPEVVKTNKNADMGNLFKPMNETKKQFIRTAIEAIYDRFISHVAEGRDLDKDYVDSIGRGRVWAAVDAYRLGLVDTLGNLQLALDIAAKQANLTNYSIVEYPRQKTLLETLMKQDFNVKTDLLKTNLPEINRLMSMADLLKQKSHIWTLMPFMIDIR